MNSVHFEEMKLLPGDRTENVVRILLLVLTSIYCGTGGTARAEDSLQVSRIQIGFDDTFRLGHWAAVECELTGPAGTVVTPVLRAADPDGRGTQQPFADVKLAGDHPVRVRGLFRSGKLNASLQLQLQANGRTLQSIPLRVGSGASYQALKQSTSVWMTIGDQPVFQRGLARWNNRLPAAVHQISLDNFDRAIWSAEALDGVDVLVLTGDVAIDDESSSSIRNWVQRGGRLIISIGDTVEQLAASPLADWLPYLPQDQLDIAKLSGLQDLVPRSSQLRTLTTIPAARMDGRRGVVLAAGLSGPLALRMAFGSGQITLVAVRLDTPPLSNWQEDSQGYLAGVLAAIPFPAEQGGGGLPRRAEFDPSAVTDLQAQISQSLDHFSEMPRAAPWSVIGWIALFSLIVGPLDYALVHYWLKRPEWTWATLAFWVIAASGLAIWRGNTLNDHESVARQMDSIDIDLTTDTVRGQSWYAYYSQRNQRNRITTQLNSAWAPAKASPTAEVCWVPRPGEGYRGMSGSGGLDETQPGYRFLADRAGIENFPVRKWSTAAVTSQWERSTGAGQLITAHLQEGGLNRMAGTIEHHLPGELTDWFIAYGNFAYFDRAPQGEKTRPLRPGEKWDLTHAASNLLRGRLLMLIQEQSTGLRPGTEDQPQRITYDTNSSSLAVCELVTSFYQAIGGAAYTGLQNESLKRLDLSETIQLKRAVLFGKLNISPLQFQLDGKTLPQQAQSVMVRMILPVQELVRDSDAPPAKEILQLPK